MIFQKKRVLACRRARGELAGCWEFPGGKKEPGEAGEEALQRELCEELGIETEVGRLRQVVIWRSASRLIRLHAYEVRHWTGELRCLDHKEMRWVDAWRGDVLAWAPADVPIWAELRRELSDAGHF
ncbi:MAG: (deoxy)nucleoside triphosphate pyrophosphohydrolase [Verrucomicrobiales bacterium]